MKVALFIPIKLNNQRLPGKNTMLLNGKPLCSYLFDVVKKIELVDEKYVYCSNDEIIPYIPEEITYLKRDAALDGPEVKGLEIIGRFINDVDADIYVLIHVTQPFVKRESVINALSKVISREYDSAFSVREIQDYCWYHGKPLNYDMKDIVTTQNLESVYMETGAFYIFRKEVFQELHQRIGRNPYMQKVDNIEAIDIDTMEDFKFAQAAAVYSGNKGIEK